MIVSLPYLKLLNGFALPSGNVFFFVGGEDQHKAQDHVNLTPSLLTEVVFPTFVLLSSVSFLDVPVCHRIFAYTVPPGMLFSPHILKLT